MESKELRTLLQNTFKQAYKLGQQDSQEGVYICLDTLFEVFIDSHEFNMPKKDFIYIAAHSNSA